MKQAPIYLLNSVNPYRLEGQKTPAFEIAEAFDWNVPDHLIVPGGNLGNSSALGKGFREMHELGLVARLPKISVIQAAGANPLVRSLAENHGATLEPVEAHTRATAIRIGNPASWRKAARVIRGDRRLVPGCDRGGDCHCQGRDRRGGAGLRAGFGGDAGGTEEAARAGRDRAAARRWFWC